MGCKYIYKDADGNPSAIYARALEKYGPERAEEIYLKHIMPILDTRFQREVSTDIEKKSEQIEPSEESTDKSVVGTYVDKETGSLYARVTALLDKWTQPVQKFMMGSKEDSLQKGKENQAKILVARTIPPEMNTTSTLQAKYLEGLMLKHGANLFEKAAVDVQSKWDASNHWGNEFHDIANRISKKYEETYLAQDANSEGQRPQINIKTQLYNIIDEAKKDPSYDRYKEGSQLFDKFDTAQLTSVFRPVFEKLQEYERLLAKKNEDPTRSSHLTLKSELKIFTDQLKEPSLPYAGIGGSVDLIAMSPNNDMNILLDFKTKDADESVNFENATGSEIHGPFGGESNTPKNRATDQMILYGTIFKKNGIDITHTMPVVIPFNFGETKDSGEWGEKKYTLQSIGKDVKVYEPEPVGNKIENTLTYFREGNMPKYYENARKNGPTGVVEKWSGNDADGTPVAMFTKNHPDSYIARKMGQIRTDSNGDKVIDFLNDRVKVGNMTPDQIKELLTKKYSEAKEAHANTGRDIVNWFNDKNPDKRIPSSLKGKEVTISALLRGIDPSTHTLELAQGAMDELEGIGPEVIIARNNSTRAVSLLSAVAVMKTPVTKYKTDGSQQKRTTFLRNYVTDDQLLTGELSENLLTTPTTHDYMALKLGIAALYLNKRAAASGGSLHIDIMRVGTVLPGERIYTTDTTPEEVFTQLGLFQKYAGEDFPSEYKTLLASIEGKEYTLAMSDHLKDLMNHISNNTDPMGKMFHSTLKTDILETYGRWERGELVGPDMKILLGKYLEKVAMKLTPNKTEDQILLDPRFIAAAKAYTEFLNFDQDMSQMAKDRLTVPFLRTAVSSGDKTQLRLHTLYTEASALIRKKVEAHMDEHNKLLEALQKEKGVDVVGNASKVFDNLYQDASNDPTKRMMLKVPGTPEFDALTQNEKNYIVWFNKSIKNTLMNVASETKRPDIANDRFWAPGTVPILRTNAKLLQKENFTSWQHLKEDVGFSKPQKIQPNIKRVLLEFGYTTQFDGQATDDNIGNSDRRRSMLGLKDLSAPDPTMDPRVEKNLALIANMGALQAAEKEHYSTLLQVVAASQSLTAAEGVHGRMTSEMIDAWKNIVIFNRRTEGVKAMKFPEKALDLTNKISSNMLFMYSVREAMIGASIGNIENVSHAISNSIQNEVARITGRPENAGRFTMKEWAEAGKAWLPDIANPSAAHKLEQMVYDSGMICADPGDLKTAKFKGGNTKDLFQSKAGTYLNRVCYDNAITQSFLAQAKHLGIEDAYVNKGGEEADERWVYDETLDKRFFAYDPEHGIGKDAPVTPDEKKRFSLWDATRHALDKEGMLDENKRMIMPLTANERAEMKNYATRVFMSFSSDGRVSAQATALGRALLRYKLRFTQKMATWWTPTIHNADMYGHWAQYQDEDGTWQTHWQGDDYEGVLQTMVFMGKELIRTKSLSFATNMNQYQRENASKLMSDIVMTSILSLIFIPLFADKKKVLNPVTGVEETKVGDLGKSTFGQAAHRALFYATADMLPFLAVPNMMKGIFPGVTMFGLYAESGYKALGELIAPPDIKSKKPSAFKKIVSETGAGKSYNVAHESLYKLLNGNLPTNLF